MRLVNILTVGALALVTAVASSRSRAPATGSSRWRWRWKGMPQGMPPMKVTQCLTEEDAEDPQQMMPQGRGRGNNLDCKVTDYKLVDKKATWQMACGGQTPMTGSGEIVYGADTYTGAMKMTMSRGGQPQTMTMKYDAKRLGDCAK